MKIVDEARSAVLDLKTASQATLVVSVIALLVSVIAVGIALMR